MSHAPQPKPNTIVMRELRMLGEFLIKEAEKKEKKGECEQSKYLRERAAWCFAGAENIEQLLLLETAMSRIAEDLNFYKAQRDKALADLAASQAAEQAAKDSAAAAQTALDAANAQIAALTPQVPDATDNTALDAADAERAAAQQQS